LSNRFWRWSLHRCILWDRGFRVRLFSRLHGRSRMLS